MSNYFVLRSVFILIMAELEAKPMKKTCPDFEMSQKRKWTKNCVMNCFQRTSVLFESPRNIFSLSVDKLKTATTAAPANLAETTLPVEAETWRGNDGWEKLQCDKADCSLPDLPRIFMFSCYHQYYVY